MPEKPCTKCGTVKTLDNFSYRGNGYLRSACRECDNKQKREYNKKNRLKLNSDRMRYYYANREAQIKSNNEWKARNKSRVKFQRKEYHINNLEFEKRKDSDRRRNMATSYVKKLLVQSGFPLSSIEIYPQLYEIKKLSVITKRKLKNLCNDNKDQEFDRRHQCSQ